MGQAQQRADQRAYDFPEQTTSSDGMTLLLNLEQWILRLLESQAHGPAALTLLLEQLTRTLGARSAVLACSSPRLSATSLGTPPQDEAPAGAFSLLASTGMTEVQARRLLGRYPPAAAAVSPPKGHSRRVQINIPCALLKEHAPSASEGPDPFIALCLEWEQARQVQEARIWLSFLVPTMSIALPTLLRQQIPSVDLLAQPRNMPRPDLFQVEALANVSHELGSPLTAIKGYASTLLRLGQQMDAEERQAFLQAIQDAGDRMHLIVDHLLKVSQLEVGIRTVQFEEVNLVVLVQEALAVAEQSLKQRQAPQGTLPPFRFVLENPLTGGEAFLRADGVSARQCLANLLGNAIRYSPRGGQVTVVLQRFRSRKPLASLPEQMPLVDISITDQGIGIAQEHLPLIFERFYRVDTRLTRETGGLGLGLAMCQRIAELHRGAIQVESTPEQGSTFHLILPHLHASLPGES